VRGIAAAVLVFESLVVFFATLVAKDLSDVSSSTVWWVGGAIALAGVLLAGLLRYRWAFVAASALQLVVISTGFVVPTMFFLGLVFGGLWFLALYLGRRVERLQAAAEAEQADK
jgi:hypothetical protein